MHYNIQHIIIYIKHCSAVVSFICYSHDHLTHTVVQHNTIAYITYMIHIIIYQYQQYMMCSIYSLHNKVLQIMSYMH